MKIYEIVVEELGTTDCNIQDFVDNRICGKENTYSRDKVQKEVLSRALALGIFTMMKRDKAMTKETALMKLESLKKFIKGK